MLKILLLLLLLLLLLGVYYSLANKGEFRNIETKTGQRWQITEEF